MKLHIPRPNPRQAEFLSATEKYIAFGGARGGGKSWAVRTKAKLLPLRYAGIRLLILRRTYQELESNHIRFLRQELHGIATYRATDRLFTFPNGSTIWFGYCATDADLGQYQGAEYDIWFADEAGQFPQEWLIAIDACVRGANDLPKRTYYTLNPGGPSHGYFKRLFVDRRFEQEEYPEDYAFIQALVTDNQALMRSQPEYLRSLQKLPPRLREAWLHGRWDVYEGQFFEEFRDDPSHYADRQWTHVIEPFDIPDGWKLYRSFDWGYNKPFSCGWWAVDYDGVAYRILELYGCTGTPNEGVKWTPSRVFDEIAKIEREHRWLAGKHIIGIADPASWDAQVGKSIADTAGEHGVFFTPGDHKRLPGWMQVHYRLAFDDNGYPGMYIFKNCRAFLRTMPILRYDERKPEDLNTDDEDHVADEVRYFCMARPITPAKGSATRQETPLSLLLDIPPEQLTAHRRPRMEVFTTKEE